MVGPQVRALREKRGWTQAELAAQLQRLGWDISRESVTRLETQDRRVPDLEVFLLAEALGVTSHALFAANLRGSVRALGAQYRVKLSRGQVPPPTARPKTPG